SDAVAVQQALWNLSSIGAGNVAVSGQRGGPWTVTFLGLLADSDQSLTINTAQLENSLVRTVVLGGPLTDATRDAIEGHQNGYIRVYRDEPIDQPLTVRYAVLSDLSVGDDAKPGVDYRKLPGVVTIPPGAVSADIVIRPLENHVVTGPRKVRISLLDPLAQTSTQPTYVL